MLSGADIMAVMLVQKYDNSIAFIQDLIYSIIINIYLRIQFLED
jgi:hypothetical protein